MGLSVPEHLTAQLREFEVQLNKVEAALTPVLDLSFMDPAAQLTPLERAQAGIAASQGISTLFQMYLRTLGIDPLDHVAAKETERLQQYAHKVKQATAAFELGEHPRTASVNISAANRFINAAIPDLTPQQKVQLKQVGQHHDQRKAKRPAGQVQDLWADEDGPRPPQRPASGPDLKNAVATFLNQVLDPDTPVEDMGPVHT